MRSRIMQVAAVIALATSALAVTAGPVRAAGRAPAAPAAPAAKAVQLTGSQLNADLLPPATFPRGYRYDSSTSYESGRRLETGQAKYHLESISCKTLGNVYGRSGFGETAVAANSYSTLVDNYTATSGAAFLQSVYQFASASAARSFWQGIRSVVVRCPGFGSGTVFAFSRVNVRIIKASIHGTQAFQADFSASVALLGTFRLQSLVALRGQYVFETDAMGLGRAAPASPSLRALMTRLLARVP